jgi:hypothetical protein
MILHREHHFNFEFDASTPSSMGSDLLQDLAAQIRSFRRLILGSITKKFWQKRMAAILKDCSSPMKPNI